MLEITANDFLANPEKYLNGAVINDDFALIQTEQGNAVLVSEAEWIIMVQAFKALVQK